MGKNLVSHEERSRKKQIWPSKSCVYRISISLQGFEPDHTLCRVNNSSRKTKGSAEVKTGHVYTGANQPLELGRPLPVRFSTTIWVISFWSRLGVHKTPKLPMNHFKVSQEAASLEHLTPWMDMHWVAPSKSLLWWLIFLQLALTEDRLFGICTARILKLPRNGNQHKLNLDSKAELFKGTQGCFPELKGTNSTRPQERPCSKSHFCSPQQICLSVHKAEGNGNPFLPSSHMFYSRENSSLY